MSVFDGKIKTNPQEMGDCLIYNPGKQKVKDHSKAVSRNSDELKKREACLSCTHWQRKESPL